MINIQHDDSSSVDVEWDNDTYKIYFRLSRNDEPDEYTEFHLDPEEVEILIQYLSAKLRKTKR
jgi:fibronectin type 3 domain-containing protein